MRKSKIVERRRAAQRGLKFIYRIACEPQSFADYGSDLLSCFYFIASTSQDNDLRRMARRMGRERACQWRHDHPTLPTDAEAGTILDLIHGSYSADGLNVRDQSFKEQIKRAVGRFSAQDYLDFDPLSEPPPTDVPDQCVCGAWNERGRKTCQQCKRPLAMMTAYAVWYIALMRTYTGQRFGVTLGAKYSDVLKWLPAMRPYRGSEDGTNPEFYDTVYAVTHIIYTLNDYSVYRLSPGWLPQEFAFLKENLSAAIAMEDSEMVGEFLDSLKAFGLTNSHPLIRTGMEYLLSRQNPDGSWGDMEAEDAYQRYHPTWTAIDGLREYQWRGARLSFPELKPLLKRWAVEEEL
jgi:hypothetical protein